MYSSVNKTTSVPRRRLITPHSGFFPGLGPAPWVHSNYSLGMRGSDEEPCSAAETDHCGPAMANYLLKMRCCPDRVTLFLMPCKSGDIGRFPEASPSSFKPTGLLLSFF